MRIRSTLAFGLAAVTTLALAGCTGGGVAPAGDDSGPVDTKGELSGTVQFQTWSLKNEKFTPYFEALIQSFEDEHPDVKIDWIDQPGDGYQDKILSQANSNTLPDVLNLPPDIAFPLVKAGKLLDLEKAAPELKDKYNEGAWDAYSQFSGVVSDSGGMAPAWYASAYCCTISIASGVLNTKVPSSSMILMSAETRVSRPGIDETSLTLPLDSAATFLASSSQASVVVGRSASVTP